MAEVKISELPLLTEAFNGDESIPVVHQGETKRFYVSQLDIPSVANSRSTSTSDVYSCDYINDSDSYSTSEIKTNKRWIDGKPIYRKVITGTISNDPITFPSFSVDTITRIEGSFSNVNRTIFSAIPYFRPAYTNYAFGYYIKPENGTLTIERGGDGSLGYSVIFIVEYTKTTD